MYRFDNFTLDLDREALYDGENEVHLRPKAFAVLKVLLENSGQLVTKDRLHDAVWKNSVATDTSIAHCIADVRRALGDRGFELVKTVPRRGYRFNYQVDHERGSPLVTKLTRNRFTRRPAIVVTALFSVALLGLGADQGRNIGARPGATSKTERLTADIGARGHHEKGRFFFKRRAKGDLQLAEEHFKEALALDADFAAAWIGLAGVYAVSIGSRKMTAEEGLPLLGDATQHAISLAPDNAEGHLRRAVYLDAKGDQAIAEQHVETALMLDPDNILALGWTSGQLAKRGRLEEAIEVQYRAVQVEPTSPLQYHNLICYLLSAGRTADAAVELEHYLALNPQATTATNNLLVDVLMLQENYEQALTVALQADGGTERDRNLAIIHYALGNNELADAAFAALLASNQRNRNIFVAEILTHRGKLDSAADWLTAALTPLGANSDDSIDAWEISLWLLSPHLIELRDDQRWQELFARTQQDRGDSIMLANAGYAQGSTTAVFRRPH